jgi:hypothetical protein
MAQPTKQGVSRGLFGLGGSRAPAPQLAPSAPDRDSAALRAAAALELATARMNLKALAGAAAKGPSALAAPTLGVTGLGSRAAHYGDIVSPWFGYWAGQLHCAVRAHRKLWEFAALLQALYEAGALQPGARALGLGCADEPLPSYLASLGIDVVASDLPGCAERERMLHPDLIDEAQFDRHGEVSNVDARLLNEDPTLRGFDICWSSNLVNQMRSEIDAADVIIGAMDTLRPGGVAVHTMDFAFADDRPIPHAGALTFPRPFFERLAAGLAGRGHAVEPLNFDLGQHPLDGYVDLPPYAPEGPDAYQALWAEGLGEPHLKVLNGDVLATSFVLVTRARS